MAGKFTHRNEGFTCFQCGTKVPPARRTCRNHCPHCLFSLHVDQFPGDRLHPCQGAMEAVGYENHKKKGLVLVFQCQSCGEVRRNIALMDDPVPDSYEEILKRTRT